MNFDLAPSDLLRLDAQMSSPVAVPNAQAALSPSAPVAWVAMADAYLARALARELIRHDWCVGLVTTRIEDVFNASHEVAGGPAAPQLLISGVRFQDGDAFQLIRRLGELDRPPALALVSHQQRAVIRAALALASAHRIRLAGVSELPVGIDEIIARTEETLRALEEPAPLRPLPRPLGRAELQALLDGGNLVPFFQPKMRLDTREVVGFEALMRAVDERGRVINPDLLIEPLLQHGLLDAATLQIAGQTVEFVGSCLRQGMGISASINVSLSLMSNPAFCSALLSLVDASGVDPSWITLEITESEAMADLATVIEQTGRIRMYGFNLSIDDFGTAYSSFFQLSQIPFSELKIERAFVQNIHNDATKRAIVGACALLGRELGLQVVAEGVETAAELRAIQAAGCSAAQGYLIARPMPAARAFEWLAGLEGQGNGLVVQLSELAVS